MLREICLTIAIGLKVFFFLTEFFLSVLWNLVGIYDTGLDQERNFVKKYYDSDLKYCIFDLRI